MSSTLVPAISLPRGPAAAVPSQSSRPLPMPALPARNSPATLYGLAVVDCHGRIADRAVLAALGWTSGQPLLLHVITGSILAMPDTRGRIAVGTDGHLRLPIGLRRRCGLRTGDRVFLAADPAPGPHGHLRRRPARRTAPAHRSPDVRPVHPARPAGRRRRHPSRLRLLLEPHPGPLAGPLPRRDHPHRHQAARRVHQDPRRDPPQQPRRSQRRRTPHRRPALPLPPRRGRRAHRPGGEPGPQGSKPRRLPSTRQPVPDTRLAEIQHAAATTGDDPALDTLLLRLHVETACRRGGALVLRAADLDPDQCLILLREKAGTVRWQPVSPTLMSHLGDHAEQRGSHRAGQLLRYASGRPITRRRYDHLWTRIGVALPWVRAQQISTHWLRHTTLTWVQRNFGYASVWGPARHLDDVERAVSLVQPLHRLSRVARGDLDDLPAEHVLGWTDGPAAASPNPDRPGVDEPGAGPAVRPSAVGLVEGLFPHDTDERRYFVRTLAELLHSAGRTEHEQDIRATFGVPRADARSKDEPAS